VTLAVTPGWHEWRPGDDGLMPLYSHNRLSVYETCARQYMFQYLDRLEVPNQAEAIQFLIIEDPVVWVSSS
jgi:hypothetical protein